MPALTQFRFYAILDTGYVEPTRLPDVCRAVVAGGAGIVQLRAKLEGTGERVRLLRLFAPLCAAGRVPLVCNDDLEAALAVEGVGLHVGQHDVPARQARQALGPERILGVSTHSLAQAQAALGQADILSYFAVGPVYRTATKPDYPAVGLELVRAVAALQPALPWFCIGGINRKNVTEVRQAGARGVVAVSDVLCDANPMLAARVLHRAMK